MDNCVAGTFSGRSGKDVIGRYDPAEFHNCAEDNKKKEKGYGDFDDGRAALLFPPHRDWSSHCARILAVLLSTVDEGIPGIFTTVENV